MSEGKWEKIKKENTGFHELIDELKRDHPEEWEAARQYMEDNIERIFSEMTVAPIYWDEEKRKFVEGEQQPLMEKKDD